MFSFTYMFKMCAKRKLINVIWQTFKNISREHICCCGKQRGEAAQVEAHHCFFCNQQGFPSLFYLSDGRGATRGGGLPPFRLPLRRDDCFLEEFAMNLDWPAEDECLCMTGLAWQRPGSFLGDTQVCCLRNEPFFPSIPLTCIRC